MKLLSLKEEGTIMCLKAITRANDPLTTIKWSDDIEARSAEKYKRRPKPMRGYDEDPKFLEERREEASRISWARGIAFGRMIEMFPIDHVKAMRRMINF